MPFLLLEGVMVAWEGLENTVINTSRQLDDMLDDKNWDGIIAKAHELRKALEGRESGGFWTQAKSYIEDLGQYLDDSSYKGRSLFAFREDKTKGIKEQVESSKNLSKIAIANVAATLDPSGSNAAEVAKKYAKYIEQAGIMTKSQLQGIKKVQGEIQDLGSTEFYNDLTQEQKNYQKEYKAMIGLDTKYQAKMRTQAIADKKKDGKAGKDPKDTTADEISAIKKNIRQ